MFRSASIASIICLTVCLANGQNLLINGNFNIPNSTAAPVAWNIWTYANTVGDAWANHADDTNTFDGSYYMQVGSDENGTSGAGLYQIVPGVPNYTYALSVESAVQNWWWPEGEIRMFFLDASATNILSESITVVTTAIDAYDVGLPWSNYTVTAVSPPGTAYVKTEVASQSGTGTVFFENAILTNAPTATNPVVTVPNLLTNGNFNSPASTAAPTGWTIWSQAATAGDAWANHASDASGFDGSYYMQVGADENGSSGAGLYQIIPGLANYSYTLSVESGVQAWWWPEGEIRLFFLDSSSNVLSEADTDVTASLAVAAAGLPWAAYKVTAVSPPGTAYVKAELASAAGSGTVFFDNAVLTNSPAASSPPVAVPPIRIEPLGDSITYGQNIPGGYRLPLYQLLTNAGYNVQFTGEEVDNPGPYQVQPDHEGHPGYRIDQIQSGFLTWINAVPSPDIILLIIGTNDYGQNYNTSTAMNRLDQLISLIASNRPNAKLVVANLLLRTDSSTVNTAIQTTFNPYVPGIVAKHAALGQQVYFLNMYPALGAADLQSDGLHPNQTGFNKMATNWFGSVINLIAPLGTTNHPAISGLAGNSDGTHVVVTFSKAVSLSATNLANYGLSGGLTILGASLDPAEQRDVTLTTSAQTAGQTYTLTVNNVQDITTSHLAIASGSTAAFTALGSGTSAVSITASISGGNIVLSFSTQTGFSYQAEYKNSMTDAAWAPLGNPITGNNAVQSTGDTIGAGARFYRITIQP